MNGRLVVDAMPELVAALRPDSFDAVAAAIMTTDTRPKTAFAQIKKASIAGMAKGSGMIHPRMATTLGFVMTDAVVSPTELRAALKKAVAVSFNRISVDGDITNDMVAVLASGASGFATARSSRRVDRGIGIVGAADRARRRGREEAGDYRRRGRSHGAGC
jgi:glutamate N-acetyltransferase/amino-acid N-acetyltransferase